MVREPLRATTFALGKPFRGVLLGATLVYGGCLFALACLAIFVGTRSNLTEEELAASIGWFIPAFLVGAFFFCLAAASYEAACLRWMIRREAPGLFGLTIDDDTWRVYGAYWAWFGLYLVAWLAHLILWGLLSRLAGDVAAWIGAGVLGFALLGTAVTFAPAAALSVHQRRFAFSDAADVTEHRFVELLGAYALLLGLQWVVLTGVPLGLFLAQTPEALPDALARVRGLLTLIEVYGQLTSAAWGALPAPFVSVAWPLSTVVSLGFGVLVYGVNARVVLATLGPPPPRS